MPTSKPMASSIKQDIADWFRGTSTFQNIAADNLQNALRDDVEQNTTHRVRAIIQSLGLEPPMKTKLLRSVMKMSKCNDLAFLYGIMSISYSKPSPQTQGKKKYNLNQQIIMSTIAHLDMIATLRELDRILPPGHISKEKQAILDKIQAKKEAAERRANRPKKEREPAILPYFERLVRPKLRRSNLNCKMPDVVTTSIPYMKYLDPHYKIPNQNRWFASYSMKPSERIVRSIIYDEIDKMFCDLECASQRANNMEIICEYHFQEYLNELRKKNERLVKVREAFIGTGKNYIPNYQKTMRRRQAIKDRLELDIKRNIDNLRKDKKRKLFKVKVMSGTSEICDRIVEVGPADPFFKIMDKDGPPCSPVESYADMPGHYLRPCPCSGKKCNVPEKYIAPDCFCHLGPPKDDQKPYYENYPKCKRKKGRRTGLQDRETGGEDFLSSPMMSCSSLDSQEAAENPFQNIIIDDFGHETLQFEVEDLVVKESRQFELKKREQEEERKTNAKKNCKRPLALDMSKVSARTDSGIRGTKGKKRNSNLTNKSAGQYGRPDAVTKGPERLEGGAVLKLRCTPYHQPGNRVISQPCKRLCTKGTVDIVHRRFNKSDDESSMEPESHGYEASEPEVDVLSQNVLNDDVSPYESKIFFKASTKKTPFYFDYDRVFKFSSTSINTKVKKMFVKVLDPQHIVPAEWEGHPNVIGAAAYNFHKMFKDGVESKTVEIEAIEKKEFEESSVPPTDPNYGLVRMKKMFPETYFDADDKELMDRMLREAMKLLKRNPYYVLAAFPDSHKLPVLREWIYRRYGKVYTKEDRIHYLSEASTLFQKLHKKSLFMPLPATKPIVAPDEMSYSTRDRLMKKFYETQTEIMDKMDNIIMDTTRKFWFGIHPFILPKGPPRNTFYAYMPARPRDIQHFRLWQPGEYRDMQAFRAKNKVEDDDNEDKDKDKE